MTAPTPRLFNRIGQLWVVISACGACVVTSATAVSYVALRDHQVVDNSRRLDKLEAVVPIVQTSLAVVQSQLVNVQTTLNRMDERAARRELVRP